MTSNRQTSLPQTSARLRADVALHAARDGHVLVVGDTRHHVQLDDHDSHALLDALVDGRPPRSDRAGAALAALADAGLVDAAPVHVTVTGEGVLATALRESLARMGIASGPDGVSVLALDDGLRADLADAVRACWVIGHRVVLSPRAVPAGHVAARHHAATLHRDTDPAVARRPGGREVRAVGSPLSGPGLELAAAHVAAELLRTGSPPHEAVVIDLVALTVSRHTVLPVPTAPR